MTVDLVIFVSQPVYKLSKFRKWEIDIYVPVFMIQKALSENYQYISLLDWLEKNLHLIFWSKKSTSLICSPLLLSFCIHLAALYTAPPPKCMDSSLLCANQSISDCSKPGSFVHLNCHKFCGLCGQNISSTGFYGKCSYKGKTYTTGEKWFDGCDYECICEDGNLGKYRCNNRYVTIYFLLKF